MLRWEEFTLLRFREGRVAASGLRVGGGGPPRSTAAKSCGVWAERYTAKSGTSVGAIWVVPRMLLAFVPVVGMRAFFLSPSGISVRFTGFGIGCRAMKRDD